MATTDKRERLLSLVATLLHTERPLTADELRARVPGYDPDGDLATFRRTFERDKDDLRELGVPISVQIVSHTDPPLSGYRIVRDDYYLRDPGLEPDELGALRLALAAVEVDGLGAQDALWRLGASTSGDHLESPPEPSVQTAPLVRVTTSPAVATLFEALSARVALQFTYNGEERTVEPSRLDHRRGHWYLAGHDRTRNARRVFRVDRITEPIDLLTDEPVEREATQTPGKALQPWEFGEDEPVRARVLIDAERAPWALQQLGEGISVERRDDGSVVVELEVTHIANLRAFVLSLLDHAEILEPQILRDDILEWLERVP